MTKITTLILALLIITSPILTAQEIFEDEDNIFSTRKITFVAKSTPHNKIIIKSAAVLRGTITINTGTSDKISGAYYKKVKTNSKSKALDYIDIISVVTTKRAAGMIIELKGPNPAPWSREEHGIIDLILTVPEFSSLEITAGNFDIDAEGPFDHVNIPKSFGKCEVRHVIESLTAHTVNRRVMIEQISGTIDVSTTNSSLVGINLNCGSNRIDIKNEGGDINLDEVTGELHLRNKYGRISVEQFLPTGGKSYIRGVNGPIRLVLLSLVKQQLIVSNNYEDIEIELPIASSAEISLAVEEDSKIELSNLPIKPDFVEHNRLYLIAGDGGSVLNASIQGEGNIYIRGYEPEEF